MKLPHEIIHGDLGPGRLSVLAKIKPVLTKINCDRRGAVLAIRVLCLELPNRHSCPHWPDGSISGSGEVLIFVAPQLLLSFVTEITPHIRVLVLAAAGEVKVTLESPSEVGLWANSYI